MAQWLRRPTVETLVFTGSSPALAKNSFLRILEQMLTQCKPFHKDQTLNSAGGITESLYNFQTILNYEYGE